MEEPVTVTPADLAGPRTFWGPWLTLGWSGVILAVYLGLQVLGMLAGIAYAERASIVLLPPLENNGFLMLTGTVLSALGGVAFIAVIVRLRTQNILAALFCHAVTGKRLATWGAVLVVFNLFWMQISELLGQNPAEEFLINAVRSAVFAVPFWFSMVVLAPLFEEVFFRGFLFSGLSRSRLGGVGTVLVSSLVWALIHIQYDWYGVVTIFFLGVLFGVARLQTGSLWTPLVLHILNNTMSMLSLYWGVETAF